MADHSSYNITSFGNTDIPLLYYLKEEKQEGRIEIPGLNTIVIVNEGVFH